MTTDIKLIEPKAAEEEFAKLWPKPEHLVEVRANHAEIEKSHKLDAHIGAVIRGTKHWQTLDDNGQIVFVLGLCLHLYEYKPEAGGGWRGVLSAWPCAVNDWPTPGLSIRSPDIFDSEEDAKEAGLAVLRRMLYRGWPYDAVIAANESVENVVPPAYVADDGKVHRVN